MSASATLTRTTASTTTAARVKAVLDLFCGDLVAFIARGLMSKATADDWLGDLNAVLMLEALERFQVQATFPNGTVIGLDYEVSADGSIRNSDTSGGFSTSGFPSGTKFALLVSWRANAPRLQEARELLRRRGWGPGVLLQVSGSAERAYAEGGYGVYRRFAGEWP